MLRRGLLSAANSLKKMTKPMLVAFDFDHTIVDDNSDIVVRKMLSNEQISEIKHLYRSDGWTVYMQKVFDRLYSNGYTQPDIEKAVNNIPFTSGLDTLLLYLKETGCDVIIISDSNSLFIEDWLKFRGFENSVDRIFTNPAKYNKNGLLEISMYHVQDWCTLSTINLCKGHILETFLADKLADGITYSKVAYIGDGKNDYCPMLRLSKNDLAFPREGYGIMECLKKDLQSENPVKASIHPWKTGNDIIDVLKNIL